MDIEKMKSRMRDLLDSYQTKNALLLTQADDITTYATEYKLTEEEVNSMVRVHNETIKLNSANFVYSLRLLLFMYPLIYNLAVDEIIVELGGDAPTTADHLIDEISSFLKDEDVSNDSGLRPDDE